METIKYKTKRSAKKNDIFAIIQDMSNIEIDKSGNKLFGMITELLSLARQFVVANVNRAMVLTYFEIGRLIVEDEQKGKERA